MVDASIPKPWAQQAYVKASNTRAGAGFGIRLAVSGDGNTLAVGAFYESSAATGIDGNQSDTSAVAAGAVYVYVRSGTTWMQQAYIKASNTRVGAYFGAAIALSADGNTLAVGSYGESSAATGVDGNQADTSETNAGAVYVYTRAGTTWTQQAYVKASNTLMGAQFGTAVSLSADGNTLAVGSHAEYAYVFTRVGTTWSEQARVTASNARSLASFGNAVALSADGSTLAVCSTNESSGATGIDGNQADTSATGAGAAYVFTRAGTTWSQQAYVKASNTRAGASFGYAGALSGDGNTLAIGSISESSSAIGVDGNQTDTSATGAGAVYVYTRAGTTWTQQAYVKASNTRAHAGFGTAVTLSADGNLLAIGASGEASAATGVDGNQGDVSAGGAGAAYVYSRVGTSWDSQAYVKASNTRAAAGFGTAVGLSGDDSTLVIGAADESSAATGIDGNQADTSANVAGAAYVFAAQ